MWQTSKRVERESIPTNCPTCGKTPVAKIQYGLPSEIDVTAIEEGRIVVGGCCITDDIPTWQCTHCGQDIHRVKPPGYDPKKTVPLGP